MTSSFLIWAAFFPRITLLLCYWTDNLPTNTTDHGFDVLAAIFAPYSLIGWWAYNDHGLTEWAILFAVLQIFAIARTARTVQNQTSKTGSQK
jgi:hypothetical protein